MTAMKQFYLDRAAESRRSASSASLANVRDRHFTAEAMWNGLAARASRVGEFQERRLVKI